MKWATRISTATLILGIATWAPALWGDEGHHQGVQDVLAAHEPGVEEGEPRGHEEDERRADQYEGGVSGIDGHADPISSGRASK